MYNGKLLAGRLVVGLLLPLAILSEGCNGDLPEVASKENFPKAKLEHLGEKLLLQMLGTYPFLPDIPPYDTSVYWYVQTLYAQATQTMHRDRQSPAANRWDQERPWQVFIIKSDTLKHAFTLPGGDLLISTGLLKNLSTDHELYALLAFEANLMHQGHQLELLIERYNGLTLEQIADGKTLSNGMSPVVLSHDFPLLTYSFQTLEKADEETVAIICETSILDPTGIAAVAGKTGLLHSLWLTTRPTYGGRASVLAALAAAPGHTCGYKTSTYDYQRFVLNVLD